MRLVSGVEGWRGQKSTCLFYVCLLNSKRLEPAADFEMLFVFTLSRSLLFFSHYPLFSVCFLSASSCPSFIFFHPSVFLLLSPPKTLSLLATPFSSSFSLTLSLFSLSLLAILLHLPFLYHLLHLRLFFLTSTPFSSSYIKTANTSRVTANALPMKKQPSLMFYVISSLLPRRIL